MSIEHSSRVVEKQAADVEQVTDVSSSHEHLTADEAGGQKVKARGSARIVDRNPPNERRCRQASA